MAVIVLHVCLPLLASIVSFSGRDRNGASHQVPKIEIKLNLNSKTKSKKTDLLHRRERETFNMILLMHPSVFENLFT